MSMTLPPEPTTPATPHAPTSPAAVATAPALAATRRVTLIRWLLALAGWVSLALAVLGVLLPGLPTTPFVLLAAACFSRASPRLHAWLLNHRQLGPMVRDWEAHRSLSLRIKCLSTGLMTTTVLLSAWQLQPKPWLAAAVLGLGGVGAWVVWRIPTRSVGRSTPPPSGHRP